MHACMKLRPPCWIPWKLRAPAATNKRCGGCWPKAVLSFLQVRLWWVNWPLRFSLFSLPSFFSAFFFRSLFRSLILLIAFSVLSLPSHRGAYTHTLVPLSLFFVSCFLSIYLSFLFFLLSKDPFRFLVSCITTKACVTAGHVHVCRILLQQPLCEAQVASLSLRLTGSGILAADGVYQPLGGDLRNRWRHSGPDGAFELMLFFDYQRIESAPGSVVWKLRQTEVPWLPIAAGQQLELCECNTSFVAAHIAYIDPSSAPDNPLVRVEADPPWPVVAKSTSRLGTLPSLCPFVRPVAQHDLMFQQAPNHPLEEPATEFAWPTYMHQRGTVAVDSIYFTPPANRPPCRQLSVEDVEAVVHVCRLPVQPGTPEDVVLFPNRTQWNVELADMTVGWSVICQLGEAERAGGLRAKRAGGDFMFTDRLSAGGYRQRPAMYCRCILMATRLCLRLFHYWWTSLLTDAVRYMWQL